jgi:hypothetical protein
MSGNPRFDHPEGFADALTARFRLSRHVVITARPNELVRDSG